MRRLLVLCLALTAVRAAAAEDDADLRKKKAKTEAAKTENADKDAELKKKATSITPDKSLAGDITRKKVTKGEAAPTLQYDTFRLGVESQVASKRTEQIKDLKKIIDLTPQESEEAPGLYFRLGELYWEESKYYFFQANRKDDERIAAMNAADKAAEQKAIQEKEDLLGKSKELANEAVVQYSTIIQNYKKFPRTDEVLYFLGKNLMEGGDDKKALVAFKRLIEKFPKSKFLADAHFAFGEYYFESSKGKHETLEKALESYKAAANFPENQGYGFFIYKQGWCYFNLGDYHKAMDQFKAVILYVQLDAGADKAPGKGKSSLAKEARNDFVRAYERAADLGPGEAKAEFAKLTDKAEDRFLMLKQLANLYYEDGKDKEAALSFNMLIKEKPLSPEAPGFQAKIVDCVLRAGNKKMTLQQVRQLVKVIQEVEKSGAVKEEKDKKALVEARELSERTLSNLAVNWHNEAKKTRDDETFMLAGEVYSDYLTLFPENPKAYDLRFFWAELLNDNLQKYDQAAEQYTRVLLTDVKRIEEGEKQADGTVKKLKPGKYMVNAAYNAILAYDEVVKAAESAGKIKTEPTSDPSKPVKIPPEKQSLVDACERYLKYVPNGDKKVEIAYKVANIYYRHNHLDEAVKRFADIALNYPEYKFENGDLAGEISANLILDSYNLLQDYAKMLEWSNKFIANEKLAPPGQKFHKYLQGLIEQMTFKLANRLDQNKEYCKSAKAYDDFVGKFPGSELACKALFNESIGWFNCHSLDKSIEARRKIIKEHPTCEFVPACIYANAEGDEAVANFEEAAHYYEAYATGYEKGKKGEKPAAAAHASHKNGKGKKGAGEVHEKSESQVWDEGKAQIALYNAGIFREALAEYKKALANREHYLELWPTSSDSEKVLKSIPDLYEKMKDYAKERKELEKYEEKFQKDPNKILWAENKIYDIEENRAKRKKDAEKVLDRVWHFYEGLAAKTRKSLEDSSLEPVGYAHYATCEEPWKKFQGIKLKWTKFSATNIGVMKAGVAELQGSIKEKGKGMEAVQKCYTQTVTFKAAGPAICALFRIGMAYETLNEELTTLKMPKGVPPELEDEMRNQFSSQAEPLRNKATEAFSAAVLKARELSTFNDCSAKALAKLRDANDPRFPPMQEDKPDFKVNIQPTQAIGDDLLNNIQAIPTVTPQQQEENKAKAQEIEKETDDLKDKVKDDDKAPVKEEIDDTPPPDAKRPPGVSKNDTKTDTAPPPKKDAPPPSKSNDEPDSVL